MRENEWITYQMCIRDRILFQELDEEAEYEYFSQAEAEEEAAVVG